MKGAAEFLHRIKEDTEFRHRAASFVTDAERMAFLKREGFGFTLEELDAVLRSEASCQDEDLLSETKALRRTKRYQVFLEVSEVNGRPVTNTVILDISAWGAKIESLLPLPLVGIVELCFILPEEQKTVRLAGEVVWAGQMTPSKRHLIGLQFLKSIDQLHREGKL